MNHKKNTKIKHRATKPTKKSAQHETEVLLSTEISGSSITHGHSPYQHGKTTIPNKDIDDKTKSMVMYIGIGTVMTIIVLIWIINLKHTLGPDAFSIKATESKSKANFGELKDTLSQTLTEVKSEIKNLEEKAKETPTSTVTPTSTMVPTSTITPTSVVTPTTVPDFKSITSTTKTINTLPK